MDFLLPLYRRVKYVNAKKKIKILDKKNFIARYNSDLKHHFHSGISEIIEINYNNGMGMHVTARNRHQQQRNRLMFGLWSPPLL